MHSVEGGREGKQGCSRFGVFGFFFEVGVSGLSYKAVCKGLHPPVSAS